MIIFFNGASSSGKTTIARAIQHLAPSSKFLIIGQDNFIKMMPYGMLGFSQFAKEGFFFEYLNKSSLDPRIRIKTGDFGKQIIEAAAQTANVLANLGFNLIIDEVLLDPNYLNSYLKNLKNHTVYFIKVFCELKILREREILRGDRSWGLADDQFHNLHRPEFIYDFTIDTSFLPSFEVAKALLSFIENNEQPQSFKTMMKF